MTELELKFVASDGVTAIALKVGQSVDGLTVKVKAAGDQQAGAWNKIDAAQQTASKSSESLHSRILGAAAGVAGGMAAYAGFSGVLSTVSGAFRSTLGAGIDFDDQMNTLRAVTGATGAQMAQLRQKAVDLGNDLSLPSTSASDAADAMVELAKGGLSVEESMAAAKGVLQLSAAAGVSTGQAATYAADALNTFHLAGKDATMVADLLAGAANASSGEITDMGFSLQAAGSVFAAAKIPIQSTVALIAEMAQNGIKGSDAGTSLKTMLMRLESPTDAATAAMKQLNIHLFDAHGNVRNFEDVIRDAQGPLAKLTNQQREQALATIFGSDAVRAGTIIFGGGTDAYLKMRDAVTKVGAAQDVAGAKSQGLGGAIRGLQSQLETMSLSIYQQVEPRLESLVKRVSDVADKAGKLLTGQANVGQVAQAGLVAAGVKPEDAAKISGKITDAVNSAGPALAQLAAKVGPALKSIGQALVTMAPPLLQVATTMMQILAPALGFAADHVNVLLPILGVLTGLWAGQQAILLATTIAGWAYTAWIYGYVAATYVVRAATLAWTAIQWLLNVALTANPIGLVIVGIVALIAIVVLLVTHWQQVVQWLGQVWSWIVRTAGAISQFIEQHQALAVVIGILGGPITLLVGGLALLITHWNQVTDAIMGAVHAVQSFISNAKNMPVVGGALNATGAVFGIPGLAEGGLVTRPTLAMVGEAGPELIVPLRNIGGGGQAPGFMRPGGGDSPAGAPRVVELHTHVYVGSEVLTTFVQRVSDARLSRMLTAT